MVKTMKNGKKTEENEGKDSRNHAFLMRILYFCSRKGKK